MTADSHHILPVSFSGHTHPSSVSNRNRSNSTGGREIALPSESNNQNQRGPAACSAQYIGCVPYSWDFPE